MILESHNKASAQLTFVAMGSDFIAGSRRGWACIPLIASVTIAAMGMVKVVGAHSRRTAVFWSSDVAPILQKRCAACHTPGGFAPMPLDSYDDARKWAKEIRAEVLSRRMPPWSAARGLGDFSNDRSLSAVEVELIASWVDGAAPPGPPIGESGTKTPAPVADLTLKLPLHEAEGVITVRVPIGDQRDHWLTAWEFVPASRARLERATITIVPGITLGTWTPTDRITRFGRDVAQHVPGSAMLDIELRYRKGDGPHDTGNAMPDRDQLALYFGVKPRRALQHRSFGCGTHRLADRIVVLAVTPKASSAGSAIEIVAVRPDKTVEPLTVIRGFQPVFAPTYWLRSRVSLPRNTALRIQSDDAACGADISFVHE